MKPFIEAVGLGYNPKLSIPASTMLAIARSSEKFSKWMRPRFGILFHVKI